MSSEPIYTLDDLLSIENKPDVLDFTYEFDDFLMWPIIRPLLIQNILQPKIDKLLEAIDPPLSNPGLFKAISYIIQTVKDRPFKYPRDKRFDILMFSVCQGDIIRDGKYVNRIVDYFARQHHEEKTLIIESAFDWAYFNPRHFPNVCNTDYIFGNAYIKSRLYRISSSDRKTIDNLLSFIVSYFGHLLTESDVRLLKNLLLMFATFLKAVKPYFQILYKQYEPKILFLQGGAYGKKSFILKWAKEHGIITVEPQHGAVSANHPAYNYGEALVDSEVYAQYLPDYFLTYGKMWEDSINYPVEKITIGNPHYTESIKNIEAVADANPKTHILIVSQHIVTGLMIKLATDLVSLIDSHQFNILFRPHPLEWPLIKQKYQGLLNTERIQIDTNRDLFLSINAADFVIGFRSTALFEAFGLCKAVYLINHPGNERDMPRSLFKRFQLRRS